MPQIPNLPGLPASWRARVTPDISDRPRTLILSARGCSFDDITVFCLALFAASRRDSMQKLFTRKSATGTTAWVNARGQFKRDAKPDDRDFDFQISGGSGHFSRTDSGIAVFFLKQRTMTFAVAETKEGLELAFTDHKTV